MEPTDFQPFILNFSIDLSWQVAKSLRSSESVHMAFSWLPFRFVKCVVKCGVHHTWQHTSTSLNYERFHGHALSKVQVSTFHPFTLKVGSKST